jgi:DNA-binding CsgD family transcriptional regulator
LNPPLTETERAVLELAARGLTVNETAAFRHVSPETVKTQRSSILRKLNARSITQAVGIVANHHEPEEALSPKQLVAVQARSASVDKALARVAGTSKRLALRAASFYFKHEIGHTNELLRVEASWLLDYLQEELEAVLA